MIRLFFSAKKRLNIEEGSELSKLVSEVEEVMSQPMTIWDDEETYKKYSLIGDLPLEERRLLIVYALLDCSVNRVAALFKVDRKTIDNRINEIKEKLC